MNSRETEYDCDFTGSNAIVTYYDDDINAYIYVDVGEECRCKGHICQAVARLQWDDRGPNGWAEEFEGDFALELAKYRLAELIEVIQTGDALSPLDAFTMNMLLFHGAAMHVEGVSPEDEGGFTQDG